MVIYNLLKSKYINDNNVKTNKKTKKEICQLFERIKSSNSYLVKYYTDNKLLIKLTCRFVMEWGCMGGSVIGNMTQQTKLH